MSAKDNPVVVNEPPDDDVKIGESPDGDRLGGDQARWLLTNRRKVLVGLGTLGSIAAIAEADLGGSGDGNLYGGTMALDKVYKIGPRMYMGPDSLKSNALSEIEDDEGWRYEAADTQVQYYLDDGAWQLEGQGSSSVPLPSVHTDSASPNITATRGDYVIYEINGTFEARNRDSGVVDHTASSVEAVLNSIYSSDPRSLALLGTKSQRETPYTIESAVQLDDESGLEGHGMKRTTIRQADGADTNLVEYVIDTERAFFGSIDGLKLRGNKSSNNSGHGVFSEGTNGGEPNDLQMSRVFVHNAPEDGARLKDAWGYKISHCLWETCDGDGFFIGGDQNYLHDHFSAYNSDNGFEISSNHTLMSLLTAQANGTRGLWLKGDNCAAVACRAVRNSDEVSGQAGFQVGGNYVSLSACLAYDDSGSPTQDKGFFILGDDVILTNCIGYGNASADLEVHSNATDTRLFGCSFETVVDDGTRTRWNGVIGGGPLGGKDLSALTGASAGDQAMSDGSSGDSADAAYSLWTFSGSDWVRADGQATITPA